MKAVGVHVFAGGFTQGVKRVMPVECQLEIHGLGAKTAERETEIIVRKAWEDWPSIKVQFVFGNPRCTGFSCITSHLSSHGHGSWSAQTVDIHDLCQWGIKNKADIIAWESVQQAYSVGKELLDYLRDTHFVPAGYRIAHVFESAAEFGNAQLRRRYFFVAYRTPVFNAEPHEVKPRASLHDVIGHLEEQKTDEVHLNLKHAIYHPDCCHRLLGESRRVTPFLKPGECIHNFAKRDEDLLEELCPGMFLKWLFRRSSRPFGILCLKRLDWGYRTPTLTSGAVKFVHPSKDRTLTVRELALIMGWDVLPVGDKPVQQLVKGVIPYIGEWFALQVKRSLEKYWGNDDWEVVNGTKQNSKGKIEKVLRL